MDFTHLLGPGETLVRAVIRPDLQRAARFAPLPPGQVVAHTDTGIMLIIDTGKVA